MNRVFWLLVSSLLTFGCDCTVARCQDCFENLIARSRMRSHASKPETPTFSFRAYPFGVQAVELESNSKSILDSIISTDALAILAERRRSKIDKDPIAENIKYPYLIGGIPDSLVWVRNNDVVILPRMLLLAPEVARAAIDSNDLIATFYAQSGGIADENDPLRKWFKKEFKETPNAVSLQGKKGRLVSLQRNETFEILTYPTLAKIATDSTLLTGVSSELDSRLVVVVLNRKVGGRLVRCIVPYQGVGSYSPSGPGYENLLVDKKLEKASNWNARFSPVMSIFLKDSDIIEITTIENVSLFRPRI